MIRKPWTAADIALLRYGYADSRTDDLARVLGRSYSTVSQKAAKLGLRKSAAYLASPDAHRLDGLKGINTRIKPGATPWNKGMPGSTGTHPASRATQFKKGRPAHEASNYVPIGSLRICADGYLERKLTDNPSIKPARRWVAVHRLVWEEAHGPVPAGHIVVFRPGKKTTDLEKVTLDALELITRAENMRRNGVHSKYPPEVARLVQLRGALTRQINRKAKEAKTP
jgi:hypothetical protein